MSMDGSVWMIFGLVWVDLGAFKVSLNELLERFGSVWVNFVGYGSVWISFEGIRVSFDDLRVG